MLKSGPKNRLPVKYADDVEGVAEDIALFSDCSSSSGKILMVSN